MAYAVTGDRQLLWLLPQVQAAEKKLRAYATSVGITYRIADFGGARTESMIAQLIKWRDEAVADGEPWYRVSPFKTGKHARGGAFDIHIVDHPDTMTDDEAYRVLGQQAPQYGLIWGGSFNPAHGAPDPYHFESQQPLSVLEARWQQWINDPAFPKGVVDPFVMLFLAAVALVVVLVFLR